jgi:ATP-dependent Clp protease ATP-binding subunit ClpA
MNLLSELPIPNGESPEQYAGKYAGLFNVSTWTDLCRELGVQVSETQSAKVALTRAVENARKSNIQTLVYSKPEENAADLMKRAIELMAPKQELNEARILELIRANQSYKGIELRKLAGTVQKIDGIFHKEFERVLNYIYNELNVYIYGPAGTGKTQIAEQVAQALGLEYSAISVCAQSSKIDFLGYMDATGKYIGTEFRKRYENGGIFLIDEIDNGNPNILAVLNAALANGQMAFPDGMIKAHSDFRCIAAANTFGTGPTEQFIGRNPIDAATQNRFLKVFIGYDNELEARIYGNEAFDIVSNCRKKLEGQTGWVLSMRDVSRVSVLLGTGMSEKEVVQICILDQLAPQFHKFIK